MDRRIVILSGLILASLAVVVVAYEVHQWGYGLTSSQHNCDIPAPPIELRTARGSGELVFHAQYSTYGYSSDREQAPVSDLSYQLAQYRQEDNHFGPGEIFQEGRLDSLSTTGNFQFHDMSSERAFGASNGVNDFFILLNPPPLTVQLRILDPSGKAIAWNTILGCI